MLLHRGGAVTVRADPPAVFGRTWKKTYHINVLELRAARFALMCWTEDLSNAEILLRMDNSTAIAYINKMGGQHSPQLNDEAQQFWHFCEAKRLWVFASYIESADNV